MSNFSVFVSAMCFLLLYVDVANAKDHYGFYTIRCEYVAEERWVESEGKPKFNVCNKHWFKRTKKVHNTPDVCNMGEPEFRNLCSKILKRRKFKQNIPHRYTMDENGQVGNCRQYDIKFFDKISTRNSAVARQCPTDPPLHLGDGNSSVFAFRLLSSGHIKLIHYIPL